jgi:hypothetical protein
VAKSNIQLADEHELKAKATAERIAGEPAEDPAVTADEAGLDKYEIVIESGLRALADQLGVGLDDDILDALFDGVLAADVDEDGEPDIRSAFLVLLHAIEEAGDPDEMLSDDPTQDTARAAFRAQQTENLRARRA